MTEKKCAHPKCKLTPGVERFNVTDTLIPGSTFGTLEGVERSWLGNQTKGEADMRTILSALIVSAVLMVWGLPSVPAQADQQRGKQGSVQQQGTTEARDARDDKEPTAEDMNTKLSRDTSGLKDTYQEQGLRGSEDSRDARDNKEAGSGSYK